jgi:dephospho-CoA kinase
MTGVFAGKPVIGIAGGIGSGKSFVADLFAELGCLVIRSDEQVGEVYRDPAVKQILRGWWGDAVLKHDGDVDRRLIAAKIFKDPQERRRLEQLVHPLVNQVREKVMAAAAHDPKVVAYVWDTPLLFETGLNRQCDVVVFVESSNEQRLQRVREHRGWDAAELARREISQWPLDRKRQISDYVVSNTADAGFAREQVRDVLSRILNQSSPR